MVASLNWAAIITIIGIGILIYLYIKALRKADFLTKVFVIAVVGIILFALFAN